MKFSKLVAIVAITSLASQAYAISDGSFRRTVQVTETERIVEPSTSSLNTMPTVVINNTASSPVTNAQPVTQTSAQPTTVVEALSTPESRAEAIRKARQNAELETEQKLVERLEDARLQEERARAERLFGGKIESPNVQAPVHQVPVQPVPVQQAPVQQAPVVEVAPQPQVTIQKVEIVQPVETVTETKTEVIHEEAAPAVPRHRFYISGLVGNASYQANNVHSNYGLGFSVGTIIDDRFVVEGSYFYSNHDVDTYWRDPLYATLDQSEFIASGKYYLLTGGFRPYLGGSASYIYRQYTDRIRSGSYNAVNSSTTSEDTAAFNLGLTGGGDIFLSNNFVLGAGIDYSFNAATISGIDSNQYGLPANSKELEKISFWTFKATAKFLF